MSRDNRHQNYGQQFGFDHYDLPPGRRNILEKIFGEEIARKASSPLVATAALLVCGAAFAGLIIASYPSGDSASDSIPVVKADTLAYKETPEEPGGMEIPNRGTTIFQTMAENAPEEAAPIENLLEEEKPVDKLAAFQREVEDEASDEAASGTSTPAQTVDETATLAANSAAGAQPSESAPIALKKIVVPDEADVKAPAQDQLASAKPEIEIPDPVAPAGVNAAKPEIKHKAGENPETIAFARSVLENSAEETTAAPAAEDAIEAPAVVAAVPVQAPVETSSAMPAEDVSSVEPASGAALAAKAITPGNYYIQLGSVSSESGASSEWGKLQKAYSSELSSLSYRVQRADLDRGTFYRIQAGPISKESAKSLCESISAKKPGGCLVTQ